MSCSPQLLTHHQAHFRFIKYTSPVLRFATWLLKDSLVAVVVVRWWRPKKSNFRFFWSTYPFTGSCSFQRPTGTAASEATAPPRHDTILCAHFTTHLRAEVRQRLGMCHRPVFARHTGTFPYLLGQRSSPAECFPFDLTWVVDDRPGIGKDREAGR